MSEETTIGMPPGIGDLHWIMTKLESFKAKNNIKRIKIKMNLTWRIVRNLHCYSIEYLKLIPFVDSAESQVEILPFEYSCLGKSGTPLFTNLGGCDYMIEFNSGLESGIKLKNILPEYETNFNYPITRPPEAEPFAESVKEIVGEKLVLLFTASVAGHNTWAKEMWTVNDWVELARKIYSVTKCKLVLVGATWDADYGVKLSEIDHGEIIHNLTGGTSVAQLFSLLRAADLLISYPCGVMTMGVQFRTPTATFWSIKSEANPEGEFIREFMRSWLPPWAEKVGYMPFAYGDAETTPDGIFTSIRKYL